MPLVWVRHGKGLVHLRQTLCLDADRREFGPDGPELWVPGGHRVAARAAMLGGALAGAFWKTPTPSGGRLWHPRYGHPG